MLDGGCGTSLIARGLNVSAEPTALWNLTHPDEVLAMHQSFVEVGAGAVQTNTFVANRMSLRAYGIKDVRGWKIPSPNRPRPWPKVACTFFTLRPW
jgi:methionine synthase I (cobalamin-dependent)